MNKLVFLMVPLVALTGIVSAFISADDANQAEIQATQSSTYETKNDDTREVDLEKGVEVVIYLVEKLHGKVKSTPDDIEQINKVAKSVEENWDIIEKQVEKGYPKNYKNIEDSLYPLIAIAKQDTPDLDKAKKLIAEVLEKLTAFEEKIS